MCMFIHVHWLCNVYENNVSQVHLMVFLDVSIFLLYWCLCASPQCRVTSLWRQNHGVCQHGKKLLRRNICLIWFYDNIHILFKCVRLLILNWDAWSIIETVSFCFKVLFPLCVNSFVVALPSLHSTWMINQLDIVPVYKACVCIVLASPIKILLLKLWTYSYFRPVNDHGSIPFLNNLIISVKLLLWRSLLLHLVIPRCDPSKCVNFIHVFNYVHFIGYASILSHQFQEKWIWC